jgi:hypothetical protein
VGITPNKDLLVFCSDEGLRMLCDAERIHGDGMFDIPLYEQVYSLGACFNGQYINLVTGLLLRKNRDAYQSFIRVVKDKCRNLGVDLAPAMFRMDLEAAMRGAVEVELPQTEITVCLFHQSQANLRWVNSNGLGPLYRDDLQFRGLVRLALALPLLPPGQEEDGLLEILNACPVPLRDSFTPFFNYFRRTYLAGGYWDSRFWNHFRDPARTNNSQEAFHSKFRGRVGRGGKNLLRVFEAIKKEEGANRVLYAKVANGSIQGARLHKYREINRQLEERTDEYVAGEVTRLHFLRAASFLLSQHV